MKVFNWSIVPIFIFILMFLSCALHDSNSGKDSTPGGINKLNTKVENFDKTVRNIKVSEFDSICSYPFQNDLLQSYVKSAYDKDYENAQKKLYQIYKQLDCISSERFMEIHSALYQEVLSNNNKGNEFQSDINQILTPLAFVFIDIGGGPFRPIYLDWIKENIEDIKKLQEDPDSTLNQIGIYTSIDPSLIALDDNQIAILSNSLDALESGNCRIIDLALIPKEDNEEESAEQKLFCPNDCQTDLATGIVEGEENESDIAGLLQSPEVEEACRQMKEAIDDLSKPSINRCFEEFGQNNDDFLACQVDNFKAKRDDIFGRLRLDQPERDIYLAQNCNRSQGNIQEEFRRRTIERLMRIQTALRDNRDIWQGERNFLQGGLNTTGEMYVDARDGDPDEQYDGPQPHFSQGLPPGRGTNEEVEEQTTDILEDFGKRIRTLDKFLKAIDDAIDEIDDQIEELRNESNDSKGRCSPESTTCSDTCSTFDQIAQDTKKCLEQATAPDYPPGLGGGPVDPNVAEPVPTDPDQLPGSIEALSACVMNALSPEDNEPITQNDCAAWTMCRNGEMPRGQDCKCLPEQNIQGEPVRNCGLWAQCPETQEGPCCKFRINSEELETIRNRRPVNPIAPIDPAIPRPRIYWDF